MEVPDLCAHRPREARAGREASHPGRVHRPRRSPGRPHRGIEEESEEREVLRKIIRNHITPDLGKIKLDKLTATRIGSHYRELEKHGRKDEYGKGKPLSANSVHKVHVVLGAILDAAIDDGLISVNPSKKRRTVNAPKSSEVRAQKPEIITWTGEQLQTFLAWNRDDRQDEMFPLWRLIAYTGMRRSEALALKWNDRGLDGDEDHEDRQRSRDRRGRRHSQGARLVQGRPRRGVVRAGESRRLCLR